METLPSSGDRIDWTPMTSIQSSHFGVAARRKLSLRLVWPGILTDADRALRATGQRIGWFCGRRQEETGTSDPIRSEPNFFNVTAPRNEPEWRPSTRTSFLYKTNVFQGSIVNSFNNCRPAKDPVRRQRRLEL